MIVVLLLITGCIESDQPSLPTAPHYPKIASWLSQKDHLLASKNP